MSPLSERCACNSRRQVHSPDPSSRLRFARRVARSRFVLLALSLVASCATARATDSSKPLNLLIITADDMNADSGGWNGNTLGATPKRGVLYGPN